MGPRVGTRSILQLFGFEIRNCKWLVGLLRQLQEISDSSEIGVVLDANEAIFLETTRKTGRGRESRFAKPGDDGRRRQT